MSHQALALGCVLGVELLLQAAQRSQDLRRLPEELCRRRSAARICAAASTVRAAGVPSGMVSEAIIWSASSGGKNEYRNRPPARPATVQSRTITAPATAA